MEDRNTEVGGRSDDEEEDGGFDFGAVIDYLGYVSRAVRLHRWVVLGVAGTIIGLTYGIVSAMPKAYHVESRLLAQKDTTLSHDRGRETDPLKGASDLVMAHEHMASLVKQLELVPWWKAHLSPLQRWKAKLLDPLRRPPTEEEETRMLVDILASRLSSYQTEGTVTFQLDWPEPEMAARIVDTSEQNFLEKRHVIEISTIAESVSIMEEHAAKVRKEIDELTATAESAGGAPAPSGAETPKPGVVASGPRKPGPRPELQSELARQKVMLDTKIRAIADLEEYRQRRLLELQASLSEQRGKYTDAHPVIMGIQQNIASVSKESPQVAALRAEVKTLQEAYDRGMKEAAEAGDARTAGGLRIGTPGAGLLDLPRAPGAPPINRDSPQFAQLSYLNDEYAAIRSQISAARIELDLAQAAFRYRYTVILPAEPPMSPVRPHVAIIMAAATVAALIFAVLAAVVVELRSGRLVHRWQIERTLKLPVLAELRLPPRQGS